MSHKCYLCGRDLTDNELDYESGYYSSSHFECGSFNVNGHFVVVDENCTKLDHLRFKYFERAKNEAEYLTRFNPQLKPFKAIIDPKVLNSREII